MHIGPYKLKNPWILAPMAGVSEMPFRVLALRMHAGAAPTELVSAKGLVYGQSRTQRYLTHDPCEQPFWVQIFGGDAESMAEGAEKAVELGAKIIDINMGCPVKKVTKNGAGSSLLCDPQRAASIVEAIRVRTNVPVTCKIRSGWDHFSLNYTEMARVLAEAGCSAIAMHARTRAQGYSGKADWTLIADLVSSSPIPVIGNGDIITANDARRMMQETGCAAVMIGRGALGNPWIFQELVTGEEASVKGAERWAVISAHLEAHLDFVGDELSAIRRFRPHLMWYAHGLENAAQFRRRVTVIEDLQELREVCAAFFVGSLMDISLRGTAECDLRTALG